jgi:hypothetical protein
MSERPKTEPELIDFVRSIDTRAPASLHERVQALIDERSRGERTGPQREGAPARAAGRRRLLPALAGGLAAAVVAGVVVAAIALSGGSGAPSAVTAASRLTLSGATLAAPAKSVSDRANLAASVDGVSFPYWEESFGWRSTGARTDTLGGRTVQTVFYTDAAGRRIGYAIVGGTPPLPTGGGRVQWRDGHAYRVLRINGAPAVVWLRDGRLCVVSGRGVDAATLLALASWHQGEQQT